MGSGGGNRRADSLGIRGVHDKCLSILQMCPTMEGLIMSEGFKGVKDGREQQFCLENVKHKLVIVVFFLALEGLFTGSKC